MALPGLFVEYEVNCQSERNTGDVYYDEYFINTCFTTESRVAFYTRTGERINAIDASPFVSAWAAVTFVYV